MAQQIEEPAKFEFTKPSKSELAFYRNRFSFRLLCIAYVIVVLALAFFLQESLILLALIFIFNVWFCYKVGVYAVRALVFPFSSSLIQNSINGSSGLRYSEDFATLLEKTYVLIRLTQRGDDEQGGIEPAKMQIEARRHESGYKHIKNHAFFGNVI